MNKLLLTGTLSALTVAAALGGACLATGNCQAQTEAPAPQQAVGSIGLAAQKTAPKKIRWFTSMPEAIKESQRTGKPIFADFYADWCPPCKMLERQTYPNAKVIAESQKWVMVKIDTEKHTDLAVEYGIMSLPTLAALDSKGEPVNGTTGFVNAADFVKFLRAMEKEVAKSKGK